MIFRSNFKYFWLKRFDFIRYRKIKIEQSILIKRINKRKTMRLNSLIRKIKEDDKINKNASNSWKILNIFDLFLLLKNSKKSWRIAVKKEISIANKLINIKFSKNIYEIKNEEKKINKENIEIKLIELNTFMLLFFKFSFVASFFIIEKLNPNRKRGSNPFITHVITIK